MDIEIKAVGNAKCNHCAKEISLETGFLILAYVSRKKSTVEYYCCEDCLTAGED